MAAGVAKAKADPSWFAGHDGGTGRVAVVVDQARRFAVGTGLAETQQTLVLNRLRGRAPAGRRPDQDRPRRRHRRLLGADEFGFATAPLVVEGCIMMRKCHLNTCPVGVATQDPVLRSAFRPARARRQLTSSSSPRKCARLMAQLGVGSSTTSSAVPTCST